MGLIFFFSFWDAAPTYQHGHSLFELDIKIQPWNNVWNTLNKLQLSDFKDNFNQNEAAIYLSEQDISKTVGVAELLFAYFS